MKLFLISVLCVVMLSCGAVSASEAGTEGGDAALAVPVSLEKEIPEIARGYGLVLWGDSIEKIRETYTIGEDVVEQVDKDNPLMVSLTKNYEAAPEIPRRRFFFYENKLYEVEVFYRRNINEDNIINALEEKYGRHNYSFVQSIGYSNDRFTVTYAALWNQYAPYLGIMMQVYRNTTYFHKVTYTNVEFKRAFTPFDVVEL